MLYTRLSVYPEYPAKGLTVKVDGALCGFRKSLDLHHLLPVLVLLTHKGQDKDPRAPHLIDLLHLDVPHTQGHVSLDILPQAANLHELKHLGCIPLR